MLPCKNCIALPACCGHEDGITCPLLYEYFMKDGVELNSKGHYKPPQLDIIMEIPAFFNKRLLTWRLGGEVDNNGKIIDTMIFEWEQFRP